MTFYTKHCLVQNCSVLDLMKRMYLLEFMMEQDYYLVLKKAILFTVEFDILLAKKVTLHLVFLIILQKSKLIHMILYLWKKY